MILSLPTAVVTDDKLVPLNTRMLLRRDTARLLDALIALEEVANYRRVL